MKLKSMAKIAGWLAAGLAALVLLGLWGSYFIFARPTLVANRARIESLQSRYLRDLDNVTQLSSLWTTSRAKDASPWIRDRIAWGAGDQRLEPVLQDLALPDATRELLKHSDYVRDSLRTLPIAGLSFVWMQKLRAYDYWNLYGRGKSPTSKLGLSDGEDVLMPQVSTFKDWAWLRLARGAQTATSAAAAEDVLHLARLLFSTENIVASITAAQMIGWIPETTELNADQAAAILRSCRANVSLLADAFPENLARKVLLDGRTSPCECTALRERVWRAKILGRGLIQHVSPALTSLGAEVARRNPAKCHLDQDVVRWLTPKYPKVIPYLSRPIAYPVMATLAAAGAPAFEHYEKP